MNPWRLSVWAAGLVCGVTYALLPGRLADRIGHAGSHEHALAFAALTAAGMAAAEWRRAGLVAVGTLALGVAIEFAQTLVPGRGFEWQDIAADLAGVAAGWLAAAAWTSVAARCAAHQR